MHPLKTEQKIKIIPEKINEISSGVIILLETDYFAAKLDNSISAKLGDSPELLISQEDYMVLFRAKINKIENQTVFFSIPEKYCFIQKREYARINMTIPVEINDNYSAKIVNIGGGGVRIAVDKKYEPNSLLNIRFNLSDKKEIQAPLKVLRIVKEKDHFLLSGEFMDLSNFDKTAIIQFCFKNQLELKCKI